MRSSVSVRSLAAALLVGSAFAGCRLQEPARLQAMRDGDLSLGRVSRVPFARRLADVCGEGGPTRLGESAFLRFPYLQKVGRDGAEVLWTTDVPDACTVRLTGPDGEPREVPATVDESAKLLSGRQYVARLQGLEPDTTYCYEVVCEGEVWQASTGFRTAPGADPDEPVRFVALGDLGMGSTAQFALLDQIRNVQFDLAVVTGDVGYNSGQLHQYEAFFFDVYGELLRHVPFFPASGNHDNNDGPSAPFQQVFSLPENGGPTGRERWYSFDWGPLHFAVLDTEDPSRAQAAWLDRDLAASTAPWKIVVAHRPPFSSGTHGGDDEVRERFVPLFEKHRVPLVLVGHEHNYERTIAINGVTYIVTGGGGKSTRPVGRSEFTAHSDPVTHFLYLTVEGDEMKVFAIDATGREFDTVLIRRPTDAARPTVAEEG